MFGGVEKMQRVDNLVLLEHDLMQFTETPNQYLTLHHFGGSEVVGSADVVVGSVNDIHKFST